VIPVADQDISNPLKELTQEITRQYISQIMKESTKQAIRKQGVKLSQSQFHKFQEKINNLTDKQKLEAMKEPLNEVKETLTTQDMGEKTLDKLSDSISHGFETKIITGTAVGVKVGITAAILITGIFMVYMFIFSGVGDDFASSVIPLEDNKNTTFNICKQCNGTGSITREKEVNRICPICNGAKELVDGTCPKCKGTGIWGTELINQTETCTLCDGDGKLNPGDPGYK
jgi:hypothetical protein